MPRLEAWRCLVRRGCAFYLPRFERLAEGKGGGFNFWALLFGCAWLLYRRIYAPAFALGAALVVVSAGGVALAQRLGAEPSRVVGVLDIALHFGLALQANRLYFQRTEAVRSQVEARGLRGEELREALRRRGGPSTLMLLFGAPVLYVLLGVATALLTMLLGAKA